MNWSKEREEEAVERLISEYPGGFEALKKLTKVEQMVLIEAEIARVGDEITVERTKMLQTILDRRHPVLSTRMLKASWLQPHLNAMLQESGGVPGCIITSFDFWNDIRCDADFAETFDPEVSHERIMSGQLGTLSDFVLLSDAYEYLDHRFLHHGEMLIYTGPVISDDMDEMLKLMSTDQPGAKLLRIVRESK